MGEIRKISDVDSTKATFEDALALASESYENLKKFKKIY